MTEIGLVDASGNDFVRVEVYDEGEAFRWAVRPGPLAPTDLLPGLPHERSAGSADCVWVWPHPVPAGWDFRVPGPASAARWLRSPDPAHVDLARDAVVAAAASVAEGDIPTPAGHSRPAAFSRLIRRLQSDDAELSDGLAAWRQECRAVRGRAGWDALRDEITALYDAGRDESTGIHGGLSIGGIIPAVVRERPALLTGPEIGWGTAGFDHGWLLGELLELDIAGGCPAGLFAAVRRQVTQDDRQLRVAAAARILLHAEDFAAHVGWHDSLAGRAALLADLDDAWAAALDSH